MWSKKNTPPWLTNGNFGLTGQAITFKQSDLIRNDTNFATAHDSLSYLLQYSATHLEYLLGPNQVDSTIPLCSKLPHHSLSHTIKSSVGLLETSSILSVELKIGPDVVVKLDSYATHNLVIVVCINLYPWKECYFHLPPSSNFHTSKLRTQSLHPTWAAIVKHFDVVHIFLAK